MKWTSLLYTLAWLFIILGIGIISYYLIQLWEDGWSILGAGKTDIEASGNFGSYVGGFVGTIFSLAGFILVYLSLREQKLAFQKERFESKFFELLSFHRENVSSLEFKKSDNKKSGDFDYKGKQVFKIIYDQFVDVSDEIRLFTSRYWKNVTAELIYEAKYLEQLRANKLLQKRKISLEELAFINLCYLIVFFGLSKEGIHKITSILKSRVNADYYQPILNFIKLKPIGYSIYSDEWIKGIDAVRKTESFNESQFLYRHKNYFKYYGGHQFRLGQYYRHLFQTASFVDSQKIFSFKEKYEYIKLLRAQLSDYELEVFFLNSCSMIGSDWELCLNKSYKQAGNKEQLITKYQFIKNIPGDHIAHKIEFKKYYPAMDYDNDSKA